MIRNFPLSTMWQKSLQVLPPLFASVTYGAGGSKQGRTLSVAKALAGMGLTVMSHLTCVGASPLRLMNYMYDLREAGVNNILALRGDPPKDKPFSWDGPFRHASDLVSYIHRQQPDFFYRRGRLPVSAS